MKPLLTAALFLSAAVAAPFHAPLHAQDDVDRDNAAYSSQMTVVRALGKDVIDSNKRFDALLSDGKVRPLCVEADYMARRSRTLRIEIRALNSIDNELSRINEDQIQKMFDFADSSRDRADSFMEKYNCAQYL